jgi:oligopeptide/dipeptide ABC transporter ATP-binding protein
MYAGRVVEVGETESVFGHPVHPYTRGLLAAIPSPDRSELLRGIEGQPPRPRTAAEGLLFRPALRDAPGRCLRRAAAVDQPWRPGRCGAGGPARW